MAIIKIIKNLSGSTQQIINADVANNGSFIIPVELWFMAANDIDLRAKINSGQFVVNDGTSDLSASDGILHIDRFQFDSANKITFDNSSNGFVATNTQTAIEESKTTAIGKARFTIVTTFNSTVGGNNWLGYNELLPGNVTPIRIPVSCTLKEITLSWNGTSVDGTFVLYKNGTSAGNIIYTSSSISNQSGGIIFTGLNLSFVNGDYYIGRWTDSGDNPSDMAVVYFFQTT